MKKWEHKNLWTECPEERSTEWNFLQQRLQD